MIERIKSLISHLGLSTRAFALNCGLRQNTLSNQLNGMRELSLSTIIAILTTYPEVSKDWLLVGDGDMLKSDAPDINTERVLKLVDTISALQDTIKAKDDTIKVKDGIITTLQDTINSKDETIAALNERIRQLENQH